MRYIQLFSVLALTACALPVQHPDFTGLPASADPSDFTCCADPERHPDWFAALAIALARPMAPIFVGDGPSLLAQYPEAISRLAAKARPLDLLVLSSKSHMSSRMLPGWFTHSAVYLGTEAQLRAAGLWDAPSVQSFHDHIREGRTIVESVPGGVRLHRLEDVLGERDAAALLRPTLSPSARRAAAEQALCFVGRDFDYAYDASECQALACSEVILRSYPELRFPIRTAYQVPSLLPDDIAAKAIRGDQIRIVDYIRATETGWDAPGIRGAMEDIAGFWGPTPIGPTAPVQMSDELLPCAKGL